MIKLLGLISIIAVVLKFFGTEVSNTYTYIQALVPLFIAFGFIVIAACRQTYIEHHLEKFKVLVQTNDIEGIKKKQLYIDWYNEGLKQWMNKP